MHWQKRLFEVIFLAIVISLNRESLHFFVHYDIEALVRIQSQDGVVKLESQPLHTFVEENLFSGKNVFEIVSRTGARMHHYPIEYSLIEDIFIGDFDFNLLKEFYISLE